MTNISLRHFYSTTGKKQVFRIEPDTLLQLELEQNKPFKVTASVNREDMISFPRLRKLLKPGHEARFEVEGVSSIDGQAGEIMIEVTRLEYLGAINNADRRQPSGKKLRQLFEHIVPKGYDLEAIQVNQNRRRSKEQA